MGCFQNEGFLYKLDQFWKKKRYEKMLLGSVRKILLFLHETIEVGLNPSNHLKKNGKTQCFYCLRNCVARWQPVVGTWDFKTPVFGAWLMWLRRMRSLQAARSSHWWPDIMLSISALWRSASVEHGPSDVHQLFPGITPYYPEWSLNDVRDLQITVDG